MSVYQKTPLFNSIDQNILAAYLAKLNGLSPIDIADLIENERSKKEQIRLFIALNPEKSVKVFEYLPLRIQKEILKILPYERVAYLLNSLSPDDRTTLLGNLPQDIVNHLLKYLSPEERTLSLKLLGYPENSVGRIMTPDYVAIKLDWTVRQVLDFIREKGRDSETINVIYAVDDQGRLVDDFRIREFLLAPLDSKVYSLADHKFIALKVEDSTETAVNIFRKYDRVALPVIDSKGILLGIVTFDDMLKLTVEEDTEDIQRIGGIQALKEPYMDIPFFALMQKRVGWLVILFLGEMLTASAMKFFEEEIAKAVVLALFIPLIISSGGNAGSQASTLVIRALALGEVKLKDWWSIVQREVCSGLFLGFVLGTIGFLRVSIWGVLFHIYGVHWFQVALVVFFALIGVVLWGTLSGAIMPLLLKKCGFDPAASSAPFVATLVDVTGLIIYFTTALFILQGTLL